MGAQGTLVVNMLPKQCSTMVFAYRQTMDPPEPSNRQLGFMQFYKYIPLDSLEGGPGV